MTRNDMQFQLQKANALLCSVKNDKAVLAILADITSALKPKRVRKAKAEAE